jgi:DNA ligase-1
MALAQTFEKIEQVSARITITQYLTNLFRSIIALTPNDLLPAIYLSINKVGLIFPPNFLFLDCTRV